MQCFPRGPGASPRAVPLLLAAICRQEALEPPASLSAPSRPAVTELPSNSVSSAVSCHGPPGALPGLEMDPRCPSRAAENLRVHSLATGDVRWPSTSANNTARSSSGMEFITSLIRSQFFRRQLLFSKGFVGRRSRREQCGFWCCGATTKLGAHYHCVLEFVGALAAADSLLRSRPLAPRRSVFS